MPITSSPAVDTSTSFTKTTGIALAAPTPWSTISPASRKGAAAMKLFIALQILTAVVIPRRLAQLKVKDERGSVTLEQAVIAGALFVIAVAAVAIITNATNGRLAMITGGNP